MPFIPDKLYKTRFKELGFFKHGKTWSFYDIEAQAEVGPKYATKAELLADLTDYAERAYDSFRPYNPAQKEV